MRVRGNCGGETLYFSITRDEWQGRWEGTAVTLTVDWLRHPIAGRMLLRPAVQTTQTP